jgi:glycolate oxidase iron-sulfur subunit
MHTTLADFIAGTPAGEEAADIIRKCVHCGFCNATCPTYRLLGNELDGPRGRIYQIKEMLEGAAPAPSVLEHLDRCLSCRACETTCPSGVEYGRLLDTGREIAEERVGRRLWPRLQRRLLRLMFPFPERMAPLLRLAQRLRGLMPRFLAEQVPPPAVDPGTWPVARHARRMVVLSGCVQSVVTPATNAAAARVLDNAGISLQAAPAAGCCGALSHHLAAREEGLAFARRNIDAWIPLIEDGAEAVVACASGCGVHLRDYGRLLAGDPDYAAKAARVSQLVRDLSEVVPMPEQPVLRAEGRPAPRVALHTPCTLQHGQRLGGRIDALLRAAGCELTPVPDAQLCCGSAGSYSLLQPKLSAQLGDARAAALQAGDPATVVTANVGCQLHLGARCSVPVRHWIELLDDALPARPL